MFFQLLVLLMLAELTNTTQEILQIRSKQDAWWKVLCCFGFAMVLTSGFAYLLGITFANWFSPAFSSLFTIACYIWLGLRSFLFLPDQSQTSPSFLKSLLSFSGMLMQSATFPLLVLSAMHQTSPSLHDWFIMTAALLATEILLFKIGPWLLQSFSSQVFTVLASFLYLTLGALAFFSVFPGNLIQYLIFSIVVLFLANLCYHIKENMK